jgi:hypothetical protein
MHAAVTEMISVIGIVIVVRGVNEAVQLVAMLMRIGGSGACGFCRAFEPGYDDPDEDRDDYGSGHCA